MKHKIIWIFTALLIILSMMCVSANEYVAIKNGEIVGEDTYEPTLFQKLWGSLQKGQEFGIVDIDVEENNICSANYVSDELAHVSGTNVAIPYVCEVGEYVAYVSEGGDIPKDLFIFKELWKRTSADDLPNFMNYYVKDLDFSFRYVCYECIAEEENPIEESCLSKDGISCVYTSSQDCETNYFYKTVCLDHIKTTSVASNELDINIKDVQVENGGILTYGQVYKITGKAQIEGTCEGCIIETGLKYYSTALSLIGTTGACGNSDSVGIKFNAKDEWVEFELYDKASEEGSFELEISAYNGCYKDLENDLKKLDSETVKLTISKPSELPSTTTTEILDYTTDTSPDNDITCYFCMQNQLLSANYDNSCEEGTSSKELDCGVAPEPKCTNDADSPSCNPSEGSQIEPSEGTENNSSNTLSKYIDYENNPIQSWVLTFIGIIIIFFIILIIKEGIKNAK